MVLHGQVWTMSESDPLVNVDVVVTDVMKKTNVTCGSSFDGTDELAATKCDANVMLTTHAVA